jgi:hypothetical protein
MIPLTEIFTYVDEFCKIFEDRIKELENRSSSPPKKTESDLPIGGDFPYIIYRI